MENPSLTIWAIAALLRTSSALAPGLPPSLRGLFPRDDAALSVCNPGIPDFGVPRLPCSHIEYIEAMCWPKGPTPLHYDEHAQCMCNGSFFPEWLGCQRCLFIHGMRNERETAFYAAVLSDASERLCTGTPTVPFRSLFAEVEATAKAVTTGATIETDLSPGNSDVGLYYTQTGPRGMGTVTGPAATVEMEGGLVTADPETTTSPRSRPTLTSVGTSMADPEGETDEPEPEGASQAIRPCLLSIAFAGSTAIALV
ncbi:hypothetical protein VUR80DRAFT_1592 [Thermomyces stellatus]